MIGTDSIATARPLTGAARRLRQLTHHSSMRESVFKHMLLARVGAELLARDVEFDELHSSVDKDGFGVLLEAGNIQRHMQLKVKIEGGARSNVTVHKRLATRPSGCVVWLTYNPDIQDFSEIRFFGAGPGMPLPDLGDRIARHSRANSEGRKAERPDHRVVPASRFEKLDDIAQLVDRLFGLVPAEPLALLRSRLRPGLVFGPEWLVETSRGNFTAVPADVSWEHAPLLADLVNGYRLLDLLGENDPAAFLERQRAAQEDTGTWPGDAVTLWITLFLEVRAEHFGAYDFGDPPPRLDQLCQQLRAALIELEEADG
jgi:hypothetical protein